MRAHGPSFAMSLVLGLILGGGGSPDPTTAVPAPTGVVSTGCAGRVLARLSLPQQVGQLIVAGVSSTAPTSAQLRVIRRHHLAGAILTGASYRGVTATRRVTRRLQAQVSATTTGRVRLWTAVDQEGGNVQVLRGPGFSDIPTALDQGRLAADTLRSRANRWGSQLRKAGINLDLAPVLDTVPARLGTDNSPIGFYYREYGHRPVRVARHGAAFRDGMQAAGVQNVAKHFPGLGRVRDNTDTTAYVLDRITTRHDGYLRPFRRAVADGIPVVMVSSAHYAKIDRRHVAAFSTTVMRGMLRHDLGFGGVIMSDDLGAAAAVQAVPVGLRAVRFISSGGTVVLTVDASTVPAMSSAVLRRARQDSSFRALVSANALRVLRVKRQMGLLPCG